MFNITKLSLKDILQSRVYLMQSLLIIFVFSFIIISMLKNNMDSNTNALFFISQYMLVLSNISMYFMIFSTCVNTLSIVEKCNRLEYYLANGVNLKKILNAYSICTFLAPVPVIIVFNMIIFLYYLLFYNTEIYSVNFLIVSLGTLLFFYSISFFINSITMLVKKTNIIYTFIFILSFIFLFGGSFSTPEILKWQTGLPLYALLSFILFILSLAFFVFGFIVRRKLDNEKIILSIKE